VRRLFWVGVGVGVTVVAIRYGRRLVAQYVPRDAAEALDTATRVARAARGLRQEFVAGLSEREQELREALLGPDADPDAISQRGRAAWAELRGSRGSAAHGRHVPSSWATGPLEDPDDDDGYAFF